MMAVDEMYMENLEECVNDENKVVTYKWLSRTLGVHVNQAKQMLFWFVQQQRNKKDNDALNVTYLVAGTTNGESQEKCTKVTIVPEVKLEATKAQFKSLTSCHVYSVQKTHLKDTNPLYMVDYEKLKENIHNSNKYSSIVYKKAQARSTDEVEQLRTVAQPTSSAPNFVKTSNKQQNGSSAGKKAAGIAGMFANTTKKSDKKTTEPEAKRVAEPLMDKKPQTETKQSEKPAKPTEKPKKGVIAFFGNQANKPKVKTTENKEKEHPSIDKKDVVEEASPMETDDHENSQEDQEVVKKPKPVAKTSTSSAKSQKPKASTARGKKKKQANSDDEDIKQKKRRRLQQQMWSDSSSDEEVETLPESPIPSPPREPSPPPREASPEPEDPADPEETPSAREAATEPSQGRRKRVRKLKDKTFIDDGGFMVTEKVYESESTDASEVEEVSKPVPKPKPAPVSPVKGKQQGKKKSPEKKSPDSKAGKKQMALTSFFKKK